MRGSQTRAFLLGAVLILLLLSGGCFLFAPPEPPTDVTASDDEYPDYVLITWSVVPRASRYEVFRATEEDGDYEKIGETVVTRFVDETASPNILYWYRVRACNPFGCSALSRADSGSRPGPVDTPLPPPQNVQASDGTYPDRIRVRWDPVAGAHWYEIQRATSAAGPYVSKDATFETYYDDLAVEAGRTYWYRVRAWGEGGAGAFSAPDAGYASTAADGGGGGGGIRPDQVRGVAASDGTFPDKIRVTWEPLSGATSYRVYFSTSGLIGSFVQIAEVSKGTTVYDDTRTAPTPGEDWVLCREYWYAVSAVTSAGEGPLSLPDAGHRGTRVTGIPKVSASQGTYPDKIVLTWDEVPGPTQSTSVVYEIWRADSRFGPFVPHAVVNEAQNDDPNTTVIFEDDDFSGEPEFWTKTYWYKVKACAPADTECGCGGFSLPVSGYVSRVPGAPTSVQASPEGGKIKISWTHTPRSGEAVTYAVYRAAAQAGPYTKIADGLAGSPFTDTAADPTRTWWYRVQACNDLGCGPLSAAAQYEPSP